MSKFSTNQLKTMMITWLSNPKFREDLKYYSDYNPDEAEFHEKCIIFEASEDIETKDQLAEHIWKLWTDYKQWKCIAKYKLKENYHYYLNNHDGDSVSNFPIDAGGECDNILVKKFSENIEQAKNCILRVFVPDNALEDDYRLEIITTPEDDVIIGWSLITD